ncbi:zinc finger protein 366 [Microcaecilia unicolor]|uniref:Zinc finger protein 710 n=1 Tax=Microcaecilia unicolor TaxID=1415580 RepID=A0A6P7WY35_9AMPH|nr:zinc finger protein 366-like [Microcaecilia unicolor]
MQKEVHQARNEITSFNVDIKEAPPPFLHGLQQLPSVMKCNRFSPFSEECRQQLIPFHYGPSLVDLEKVHGSLEGGSRKRKPSKMPYGSVSEDYNASFHGSMNDDNVGALPLIFPQPQPPKCNSRMINLCNIGLQLYSNLEHLGAKPIKQEPISPSMMWYNSHAFLQPTYPYYSKVHPNMMFPFFMPSPNMYFRHPFHLKKSEDQSFQRAVPKENDDSKQNVERIDVNIQIDDSYYVDVGGDKKRWKCSMCEKSYTSKYNLVTHILGHSGIKPHACTQCGKLFKQLSHLHTHMLTHQGTRPHKCQVCHKAFTQTSHLKRHLMQHSDVKPYNCRICGRGFAYPSELKAHELKHESGRENICVECGLDFPTLAQLKRHLTSHRGPIQYNCTECDKTFQYPSQLQNHMMKHKDIRPYICTECGMEFVQPHHLKQHSLTHKGVKEHKCGICGREFTLLANMKRHILIHTNIRAYQCHLCFKSFVQKQTLKAHMIVHSDVKPFKCKLCGKEFNRMHNLMGHMHLHSDSKPFKCLYCPSKFTLKGNLTRHMKVKHGIMERGFSSKGYGRGRMVPSQADVVRNLEQEEPFDLSKKRRAQLTSFHSDGESAKGSSCHEEEDDSSYSPGTYRHRDKVYLPEGISNKPAHIFREPYCDEKEDMLSEEDGLEENERASQEEEEDNDKEECLNLRCFENSSRRHSTTDYPYFKHRKGSLRKLFDKKMQNVIENQTALLGI